MIDSILQIVEVDNDKVKVHYYVEDAYKRGYRKEKKAYWIDRMEIRNDIKNPCVLKVGLCRELFVFDDLK